jgi:hypothetical protein
MRVQGVAGLIVIPTQSRMLDTSHALRRFAAGLEAVLHELLE